jgi:carboxyl-terminal processing protease
MVLLGAALTGGWFLQKGVSQEKNVYFQVRLFQEVVDHVMSSYVDPVDRAALYESAIDGFLEELEDPNTSFLRASDFEDFRIRTEGAYGGVGLEVIPRDGWVTVVTPLSGSPGTRAGIRAGDQIVEVDGQPTDEWSSDRVVGALRGEPGTQVEVGVRRPGVDAPIPFTVTRGLIELHSVPFSAELDDGIGYVPLQLVSETSSDEVAAAVDSLLEEGARGLILDLRGNPGGLLDQGVAITDYFLDPGQVVVETRGRARSQNETFAARRSQPHPDLPVVVLVDERSASASEIIAGALQDHDRALVVGAPSFGKGSVQTLFPLSGGNVLRLTTARWYTPSGRSIHKPREDQIGVLERSTLTLTGDPASRPDTVAKPVFQTSGGRRVLGGGGIIPDVLVMPDTLSLSELEGIQELDRYAGLFMPAVFNYAVLFLQDHPNLDPSFHLTSADLEEFRRRMPDWGLELSRDGFQKAERFIRFQLEREIALKAWGDSGEFRRILPVDHALQRAMELLTRAGSTEDLFLVAEGPGVSDWAPPVMEERGEGTDATGEVREADPGNGEDGGGSH